MPQMLGPLDEYPLHQLPQPIAWPGSSSRNFYDRSYFNARPHREHLSDHRYRLLP